MSSSFYDFVLDHPDVTLGIKACDLLSFGRRLIAEQKEACAVEESDSLEVFLTAEQVIEMTQVSESTLRRWRVGGRKMFWRWSLRTPPQPTNKEKARVAARAP